MASGVALLAAAPAWSQTPTETFEIRAASLQQALLEFSRQANVAVVADAALVRGRPAPVVQGQMSSDQALERLLAGSGLRYERAADNTITIRPAPAVRTGADVGAGEGDVEQAMVDEVIVTATKRAADLQKVPLSVAVVTGDALEARAVDRAIDAALQVPSVVFQQTDEARTASISVRGVGSNGVTEGWEPSVSTIVDGEVYARTTSLTQSVADVERVEVLRGPQGVLYGKNTSAGAVSIVTKKPRLGEFEGQVNLRLAQDEERTAKAVVNVPLGDTAALRVNAFGSHIGGWLNNAAPDQDDLVHSNAAGVRAQLYWAPSETFDAVLRADYARSTSNGGGTVRLSVDNTPTGTAVRNLLASFGQPVGPDAEVASADASQYSNIDNRGVGAELTWRFSDYELKSLTFYRENDLYENRDQDALPVNFGPLRFGGDVKTRTFQEELRLTSPQVGRFSYIAGLFYYHGETSRNGANQTCTSANNLTVDRGGPHATNTTYYDPLTLRVTDCQGAGVSPYNTVNNFYGAVTRDNGAAFANLDVEFSDSLKGFVGGRFLVEKTSIDFYSSQDPSTSPSDLFHNDRTDREWIGRAGLQYFPTDDVNLYASYSTGYKGPTFNDSGGSTSATLADGGDDYLEPEHSEQIELGLRSQFFDRRLTVNVTGYRLRIDDFQEQIRRFVDLNGDGVPDDFDNATINAGRVETRGIEWDIALRPLRELRLSVAGAYTDAFYADFGGNLLSCPTALIGTPECFRPTGAPGTEQFIDPNGRALPRAPKWQHFFTVAYGGLLPQGYAWDVDVSYRWQSKFNFNANQDPLTVQRSYGVLDANVTIKAPNERYALTLFAHNLTDERYYSSILANSAQLGGGYRAGLPRDARRWMGVSLKASF